ncbi:MAG: hypothetical protein R3F34_01700 [Planctomycetota bacterium]
MEQQVVRGARRRDGQTGVLLEDIVNGERAGAPPASMFLAIGHYVLNTRFWPGSSTRTSSAT